MSEGTHTHRGQTWNSKGEKTKSQIAIYPLDYSFSFANIIDIYFDTSSI